VPLESSVLLMEAGIEPLPASWAKGGISIDRLIGFAVTLCCWTAVSERRRGSELQTYQCTTYAADCVHGDADEFIRFWWRLVLGECRLRGRYKWSIWTTQTAAVLLRPQH